MDRNTQNLTGKLTDDKVELTNEEKIEIEECATNMFNFITNLETDLSEEKKIDLKKDLIKRCEARIRK